MDFIRRNNLYVPNASLYVPAASGGGGGPSAEYTAWKARTTSLDSGDDTAMTAFINGLVSDSVFSKHDALWITGLNDVTNMALNLVSSSFSLILNGTPNFTAHKGILGVDQSGTVYADTQYNPATNGINQGQDSACFWAKSLTSTESVGSLSGAILGAGDIGHQVRIFPRYPTDSFYSDANSLTQSSPVTVSNANNFFAVNRSDSSHVQHYVGTSSSATTETSASPPSRNVYLLATNSSVGPGFGGNFRLAAAGIAGSLSSTDISNLVSRLNTLATALGW